MKLAAANAFLDARIAGAPISEALEKALDAAFANHDRQLKALLAVNNDLRNMLNP
jgi:hypothetical protein